MASEVIRDRRAVVILGMHRSGTSALARSVSLCGHTLPCDLIRPNKGNPKGFWESIAVVALNDVILTELGASWDRPGPFICRGLTLSRCAEFVADFTLARYLDRARAVLVKSYRSADAIVLKDPRLCLLPDLWTRALEELGYSPRFVLAYRNPLEVAASLNRRNQISIERGIQLWLYYNLCGLRAIERHIGDERVVSFHDLLADPVLAATRVSGSDAVPEEAQNEIRSFVSGGDNHYRDLDSNLTRTPQLRNAVRKMWSLFKSWHDLDEERRAEKIAELDRDCDGPVLLMELSGTMGKGLAEDDRASRGAAA